MPIISNFYGISIRMYFQQAEHNPPHVHAAHGKHIAAVSIHSGVVLEGYLPPKTLSLVQKWISLHKDALLLMWDTQDFKRLPPLS